MLTLNAKNFYIKLNQGRGAPKKPNYMLNLQSPRFDGV
jgi:hypothetical protein